MILAQRGEMPAALTLAGNAVEMAERTAFVLDHAWALEALAEVLGLAGRPDEAQPVLAKAIAIYEQKGVTVLADRAHRKLTALRH